MFRTSIKNLLAHKAQLMSSALSVVLGVSFLAGSLLFTDTLKATFTAVFLDSAADVTVTAKPAFTVPGAPPIGKGVPASLVDIVRGVDGVAAAEPVVKVDGVQPIGKDGRTVGTQGASTFGVSWSETPGISALSVVEGRPPRRAGEIAIDAVAARKARLAIGDRTSVLTPRSTVTVTVVGVVNVGRYGNLGGASLTVFDRDTAQRLLLDRGFVSAVAVRSAPGLSRTALRDRIAAAAGAQFAVRTKEQQADADAEPAQEGLKLINNFLFVFAFVALFVGVFVILNTFSILVAQRTRELAVMRALGTGRRQVTRSVLVEGFAVGALGSTLGIAAGLGIALVIRTLFASIGIDIPTGPVVVRARTVLVSYAVGIVVTMIACYVPARRASRVPPVAAIRDEATAPEGSLLERAKAGLALVIVGALVIIVGLGLARGPAAVGLVGQGVLGVLTGTIVLSPILGYPVVRLLGAALPRMFGPVGRMSRENVLRSPRRSAATAGALIVGLALVTAVSVVAASMNASVDRSVDRAIGSDFVVNSTRLPPVPFSPQVADVVRSVDGVRSVSQRRGVAVEVAGTPTFATGIDPATADEAFKIDYISGGTAGLRGKGMLVVDTVAEAKGWKVGDAVPLRFQDDSRMTATIGGIFRPGSGVGWYVLSLGTLSAHGAPEQDSVLYVWSASGRNSSAIERELEGKLAAFPNVRVLSLAELKQERRDQVNSLLGIVYALLALSILIAVLGIMNTLALSVIERTREIGLLRAVGMSRRQLRRMVRWESVVISVFAAVLGLALGLFFGVTLQGAMTEQGVDVLSIPVGSVLGFLVAAAFTGVLAGMLPAWRAARLDVRRAMGTR